MTHVPFSFLIRLVVERYIEIFNISTNISLETYQLFAIVVGTSQFEIDVTIRAFHQSKNKQSLHWLDSAEPNIDFVFLVRVMCEKNYLKVTRLWVPYHHFYWVAVARRSKHLLYSFSFCVENPHVGCFHCGKERRHAALCHPCLNWRASLAGQRWGIFCWYDKIF